MRERIIQESTSSSRLGFEDIVRYQSLFRNDGLFNFQTIFTIIQLVYYTSNLNAFTESINELTLTIENLIWYIRMPPNNYTLVQN